MGIPLMILLSPFKIFVCLFLLSQDTRSLAEFEVSHLPEAILVPPETDAVKEIFKAWFKQGMVKKKVLESIEGFQMDQVRPVFKDMIKICLKTIEIIFIKQS